MGGWGEGGVTMDGFGDQVRMHLHFWVVLAQVHM